MVNGVFGLTVNELILLELILLKFSLVELIYI